MTFVTKLTVQSGDRALLDDVVGDIKETAARKGVQLKGPHSRPPRRVSVPQQATLTPEGVTFDPWDYTVYTRELEIHGADSFARSVAGRDFPASIHVEVEIEQIHGVGRGRR